MGLAGAPGPPGARGLQGEDGPKGSTVRKTFPLLSHVCFSAIQTVEIPWSTSLFGLLGAYRCHWRLWTAGRTRNQRERLIFSFFFSSMSWFLAVLRRSLILTYLFWPHQGAEGLPGVKGDTGDPGKSVSLSTVHEVIFWCSYASLITADLSMIIDLFLGISRSNWRAGTTWTSWKKGLCVFCLHVSQIFLLVYDSVLLCMCASLHLCDRFRLKVFFVFF